MHRRIVSVLIGGLVLIAGCATTTPSTALIPLEPPTLDEPRYSCSGRPPGIAPSLLDEPASAELEDHPSAAALRATLAAPGVDFDFLPASGWWLVGRDDLRADYLALGAAGLAAAEPPFVEVSVERVGGDWNLSGWGQCRLQIVLDGLSVATWELAPGLPAPGQETTQVTALVTERECASGQEMGNRLQPPLISYTDTKVVVVFAALPPPGQFQTCPSNPSARVTFELREPLGDRTLLDGFTWPLRDPSESAF